MAAFIYLCLIIQNWVKVFSFLQRQEMKPVKSTQMNQESEDWPTLWITIGPCLLLHFNRKMKEECNKDTACVETENPLTWDPVASDAWASLRKHLLSGCSYFMAQLYVYWPRDPMVTFQVSIGPDNWSDLCNCVTDWSLHLMLVAKTQTGRLLKEIWSKEVKGYSIIRVGTVECWGGCREGERKQIVQQQIFQVQNALGKVTCRFWFWLNVLNFSFSIIHKQAN